jgi:hypothetical protein
VFESYSKVNLAQVSLLKNSLNESKTDILIEMGCTNGVLGTLASKIGYKKFHGVHSSVATSLNTRYNLEKNGLDQTYFDLHVNLSKTLGLVYKIVEENGPDSRICFIFQNFEYDLDQHQKRTSKN